ncbi:hypothetical protein BO224_05910 [Erysipelotrichaceae bacterium NYU-BL-E8]|uniref:HTH tetR-type domain-containing protein n=3 Tax=Ileibacterium valens TaxID=1862668 RepID=A0A1U7NGM5_9FIRM|nr:TetR/AcrR family transcriptional regulator [Ileibacterium valens]OLU39091.1 hypothetical protein BM735_07965 [Erysipelotrichaceae bacterium NYU-BL-F16]OLU40198.1 hypothetical protein BO224_05910 [Erysipelotrichaceae bacterium NYU-BL-E8]OLU40397.1 hypothetical protein BO222_05025 [Ileibacterium valens]
MKDLVTAMNTKYNQRFIETENRILNVTEKLVATLGVPNTSVSEICRQAGINRKSFYLHYPDVESVLIKIESIKGQWIQEQLFAQEVTDLKTMLSRLFELFEKHKAFYRPYLCNRCPQLFLIPVIEEIWISKNGCLLPKCKYYEETDRSYHELFFKSGFTAILTHWMERDCAEPADLLADVVIREYQANF